MYHSILKLRKWRFIAELVEHKAIFYLAKSNNLRRIGVAHRGKHLKDAVPLGKESRIGPAACTFGCILGIVDGRVAERVEVVLAVVEGDAYGVLLRVLKHSD